MQHTMITNNPKNQHENTLRMLTPDEAAQQLRVTAEQIRSLIRKGRLSAVNVGAGKKRPLYRITPQALQDFLENGLQAVPSQPEKRFKQSPPVQDFFPDLK